MPESSPKRDVLFVQLEPGYREWYQKAAAKQGYQQLSSWVRWRLNAIAEELAGEMESQAPAQKPVPAKKPAPAKTRKTKS